MIPSAFCWTRIGAESGQQIDPIIRRKEMERRLTGGFVWGIGNALGDAPLVLAARQTPYVLFSPIAGRPAPHDVAPSAVVSWTRYVDHHGRSNPLPAGILVTSRAHGPTGIAKRQHYALFCRSTTPLQLADHGTIDIAALRNLLSQHPVGSSQNTAVVERRDRVSPGRAYRVALICELTTPFYATLTHPVTLPGTKLAELQADADAADDAAWLSRLTDLLAASRPSHDDALSFFPGST